MHVLWATLAMELTALHCAQRAVEMETARIASIRLGASANVILAGQASIAALVLAIQCVQATQLAYFKEISPRARAIKDTGQILKAFASLPALLTAASPGNVLLPMFARVFLVGLAEDATRVHLITHG